MICVPNACNAHRTPRNLRTSVEKSIIDSPCHRHMILSAIIDGRRVRHRIGPLVSSSAAAVDALTKRLAAVVDIIINRAGGRESAYQRYGLWRAYARARARVPGSHSAGHTWLKKCERLYQGTSRCRPSTASVGRPRCVNVGGGGVDGGGCGGEPPLR